MVCIALAVITNEHHLLPPLGTRSVAYPEVAETQDTDLPSLDSLAELRKEEEASSEHNPLKPAELQPGSRQLPSNSIPQPSVQGYAAIFRPESSGVPASSNPPAHQMQSQLPTMADPSPLQPQTLYAPPPGALTNPPHTFPQHSAPIPTHSNGSNMAHFAPDQMAHAPTSVLHQVPPAPPMQYGVAGMAWNGSHPQQIALASSAQTLPQPPSQPHSLPLQDQYPPVSLPTSNGYPGQQRHPMTMPHGFEHAQLQQGMYQVQHAHPQPQWVGHAPQIAPQQLPTPQPVSAPVQQENMPGKVSVPELDIVGQQLQTGMAQNAETKDEIEDTKRQLDELKQILRQRQVEEEKKRAAAERQKEEQRQMEIEQEKRRHLERERQRQLADEAQRNIMEERLELLERENMSFKEQQVQLALQTQMMLAKAEQLQSLQSVQPQEMVPPRQPTPPTQDAAPNMANTVPQSGPSVPVNEKTNASTDIAQQEPVNASKGGALSQPSLDSSSSEGLVPVQGEALTSTGNKANKELVKKMEELEARLKLLQVREKSLQSEKEKQDHILREREAAMKKEQAQWAKQKEHEERALKEEKAKLAEDQAAFLRLQAEVKKQQEEYRLRQEELFGMMQLMNRQQSTGARQGMQISRGNLPPGWEKQLDHRTGRFYYIDHKSRTTHWNPPTNWLMYGQDSQPPTKPHPQLQVVPPTVGGASGSTPSAGMPVAPSGGHPAVQPPSQPKVDRSMKPQQPLPQPEVNRTLKPMSPALLQQKTRTLQAISGSWVRSTCPLYSTANKVSFKFYQQASFTCIITA